MSTPCLQRSSSLLLEALEDRVVPGSLLTELLDTVWDLALAGGTGLQPRTVLGQSLHPTAVPALSPANFDGSLTAPPRPSPWKEPSTQQVFPAAAPAADLLLPGLFPLPPRVRGPILAPGATYLFDNNLFPEQEAAPWLIPLDPYGQNRFETAQVFGHERTVYRFDGGQLPARENAGLLIGTQGLVAPNSYSLEFIFACNEGSGSYRRLVDLRDRTADPGLYLSPSNVLNVYPDGSGTAQFPVNTFRHVVLTYSSGTVNLYVDGVRDLTLSGSTTMAISSPLGLLYFFVDDEGGATGEYADMTVALLRLYDGILTPTAAAALASDPFAYP